VTDILMPALSPTMEEGTLAKWHVKVGDTVKSGDVIAEIETDKATMEVEAVDEGVIDALLVPEGTEAVKVNAPIARLAGEGEAPATPTAAPPPAETAPAPMQKAEVKQDEKPAQALEKPTSSPTKKSDSRILASPLARRLAEQRGIDLASLKGSGPHGRIIRRDLDGAPDQAAPAKSTPAPQAPAAPAAEPAPARSLEQMGIPPAHTISSLSTACARPSPAG